jgi:hypothetical protein
LIFDDPFFNRKFAIRPPRTFTSIYLRVAKSKAQTEVGYRTVRYRTVGYRTVEYRTVGYRTVGYRTVGYRTVGYRTVGYRTVGYRTVGYRTVGYSTVGYRTVGYRTVGYRTVGYRTVGYRTVGTCGILEDLEAGADDWALPLGLQPHPGRRGCLQQYCRSISLLANQWRQ